MQDFNDTHDVDCINDRKVQHSKLHQHEQAAKALNKSYPLPASNKIMIDDGETTIRNDHQHESSKAFAVKTEDKSVIVKDDSYGVGIVNDIKENNR